jgi:hypothetical protein
MPGGSVRSADVSVISGTGDAVKSSPWGFAVSMMSELALCSLLLGPPACRRLTGTPVRLLIRM